MLQSAAQPEMEPPPGEQQLSAEVPEDPSPAETTPVLVPIVASEQLGQDAEDPLASCLSYVDDDLADPLATTISDSPATPLLIDDCIVIRLEEDDENDVSKQDMGSYVSRSSSEEDDRYACGMLFVIFFFPVLIFEE